MRTVYLGTSGFAAAVLRRLAASPHRPALVVTPPDSRRGRGRRLAPPPAADAARELGIDVLQARSVNDEEVAARVRAAAAGVGAVCAFGQLIADPLLGELEMLNVHPSLLPRWRGAAPIERAILAGDAETGVTILRVTAGLDSGPIALREPIPIAADDDFGSVEPKLAALSGELLVRALDLRAAGELALTEQDEAKATYAEKIAPEDRRLDPSRSAAELERRVRALNPHIGTYLTLEGDERLGVRRARAGEGDLEQGALETGGDRLVLGCGSGTLEVLEVKPPGGRPMPAGAYLRGHTAPGRAL
ncbi:MAG TPA: methionyl-tRNA formyltransferase [Solirubrobacterales bacterium]